MAHCNFEKFSLIWKVHFLGTEVQNSCPSGLIFDTTINQCNYIANIPHCDLTTTAKTTTTIAGKTTTPSISVTTTTSTTSTHATATSKFVKPSRVLILNQILWFGRVHIQFKHIVLPCLTVHAVEDWLHFSAKISNYKNYLVSFFWIGFITTVSEHLEIRNIYLFTVLWHFRISWILSSYLIAFIVYTRNRFGNTVCFKCWMIFLCWQKM